MRTMQLIVFLLCIFVIDGVYLQAGGDIRLKGSMWDEWKMTER